MGVAHGFSFVTFLKCTFPQATPKEPGGIPERPTLDSGLRGRYFGNSPLLGSYLTLKTAPQVLAIEEKPGWKSIHKKYC